MVDLSLVRRSNTHLPERLTAVFVGGTSGIGRYTLEALAKHCATPTIYFIGRSQSSADELLSSLQAINSHGIYHFIQSDVSVLKNVDAACERLLAQEPHINLLVLSQGMLDASAMTSDGLSAMIALMVHSRIRFILNLLPLLRAAPDLRRVVSVLAGSKAAPITDVAPLLRPAAAFRHRGARSAAETLLLEELALRAPEVSFVHSYPGPVQSGIARGPGVGMAVFRALYAVFGSWVCVPTEESGERHLFLGTSARYPGRKAGADGVATEDGGVAKGADGSVGSGVYVVDEKCVEGGSAVVKALKQSRDAGKRDEVWKVIKEDFERITGKESL